MGDVHIQAEKYNFYILSKKFLFAAHGYTNLQIAKVQKTADIGFPIPIYQHNLYI